MRKLETIRAELATATKRLSDLQNPALLRPKAEALAAVGSFVDECAGRARQFVQDAARAFADRTGSAQRFVNNAELYEPHRVADRMQDVCALLAGDAMRAEMSAAVSALYDNAHEMSEADRARAIAETSKRIAALEHEEYRACIESGQPLREGTRPELILGLE